MESEAIMNTILGPTKAAHPNSLSHGKVRVSYGTGNDQLGVGFFRINSSPLVAGADYTLQLPAPDTYADKLAALHEYAHYILCIHGGRDYVKRNYAHNRHELLEEESLAWALALRWTKATSEAYHLITGRPNRWLEAAVASQASAGQWLQAAVKVVDTIYATGRWPGPTDRWIEAPE